MTFIDLLIVLFAVSAALGGYRMGLLARGGSWIGLIGGLVAASFVVGRIVEEFDDSEPSTRLLVAMGVVFGCGLIGQAIGLGVGYRLRRGIPRGAVRTADHVGGAIAGAFGVLITVWLLLPALGVVPGDISRAVRNSVIVAFVDDFAPEPPAALRDLSQQVTDFDFPEVFTDLRPAPDPGPPPSAIPIPEEVQRRVAESAVNVEGQGCGRIQEGSGFVVEPGLVATNAHVVAGTDSIRLLLPSGERVGGTVVLFDGDRDLAFIAVDGLDRSPLPIGEASVGQGAAVFGHPGGQDQLRIAPATVGDQREAVGRDISGRGSVSREILILAAELRQGDSGAAVVDAGGNVIGVAFAIAPDRPGTAYALAVSELREALAAPRQTAASTGGC